MIYIALVDDWEIRGNGLGDVKTLQYDPAISLMNLYDDYGIKNTFNVETMQGLSFREYSAKDKNVHNDFTFWIQAIEEMIDRGHDIQLHIHPQFYKAQRINHYWKINKSWSFEDYTKNQIDDMVQSAHHYLKEITLNKSIKSFRSGSWSIQNCPHLFNSLEKIGIKMDISIVDGLYYEGGGINLDYRNVESPYMPYYPNYEDARTISKTKTEIVEIPTQSVKRDSFNKFLIYQNKVGNFIERIKNRKTLKKSINDYPKWIDMDPFGFKSGKAIEPFIIDFSANHQSFFWKKILKICIDRFINEDKNYFVVFENHTKDLQTHDSFKKN